MLQNKRTIPARNRTRHQVSHSVASRSIRNAVPRPPNRSTDRTAGVNIDKRNILGANRPQTKHSNDTVETSAALKSPGALQYNTAQPTPMAISVVEENNFNTANVNNN